MPPKLLGAERRARARTLMGEKSHRGGLNVLPIDAFAHLILNLAPVRAGRLGLPNMLRPPTAVLRQRNCFSRRRS